MFINMNGMFETYVVTFETYIEDKLVKKQTMQAPQEMLMISFVQTMEQIINDKRPIKIRMTRQEVIWDNFENKQRVLDNEVAFSNNAMLTWEETNNS